MITETCFTVRSSEIDRMGIVHHSNYPLWFEAGRREHLKRAGISHSQTNALGFFLPLSEIKCEYKSPARYKDKITVITKITYMSCVKIKFEYRVLNKTNGKVLATGRTVHAWTDRSIQPINIEKAAPQIYNLLKPLMELPDDIR